MTAYNYQCESCFCTIYSDPLPDGERYYYVVNGDLCPSCQAQQDARFDDDDVD